MSWNKRLDLETRVLPLKRQLNQQWLHYVQNNLFYQSNRGHNATEGGEQEEHLQTGEAQLSKTCKTPELPRQAEIEHCNFTHQPCEACKRSKGRPGTAQQESMTQVDNVFLHHPTRPDRQHRLRTLVAICDYYKPRKRSSVCYFSSTDR